MNFKHFDRLLMEASYDEVKVIGRDVELDGHYCNFITHHASPGCKRGNAWLETDSNKVALWELDNKIRLGIIS